MLTHQQRIAMYENEIARLYECKDDMHKDVVYYKNKVTGLEMEIKDLQTQKGFLENEVARHIREIKKLQGKNKDLQDQTNYLRKDDRERTREINEIKESNKMLYTTIVEQVTAMKCIAFEGTENPVIVERLKKVYDELSKAIEESR